MQVISGSIIALLEANDSEKGLFPGTTSQAEILFTEADGDDKSNFEVDKVDFRNFNSGSSDIQFSLNGPAVPNWKVSVTKRRITVWNAASWGMLGPAGKAKIKTGRASGGHLKYGAIAKISTFMANGNAVLILVSGKANPKILRGLTFSGNLQEMQSLLDALYRALDNWLIENGCKENDDANNESRHKRLSEWDEFLNKAWTPGVKEVTVQVPSTKIELLP